METVRKRGEDNMKKLYGVIPAMVTPFDDQDKFNASAMRKLVDYMVEGGVQCLYPLGTTGEMDLMTTEERKQAAETVIEQSNGRLVTYIHVGAPSLRETVELAQHAKKAGADGVAAVTPIYFKVNDREMEEYYVSLAKSLPEDFPVYAYNIPQLSGNDIKPEVLERIVKRAPNVVGIKYSLPDMVRTAQYVGVNNNTFSVAQGADNLGYPALVLGCDGFVSGCANVFPKVYADVYAAYKADDQAKGMAAQKLAFEAADLLCSGTACGMAYLKEGLRLMGIDVGHVRRPLLDASKEELAIFTQKFNQFIKKI